MYISIYKMRCLLGCARNEVPPLHRFPNFTKFPEKFKAWVFIVGGKLERPEDHLNYKNKRICDIHFTSKDRNRNNRLSAIAVPSLHLPMWCNKLDENSLASELTVPTTSKQTEKDSGMELINIIDQSREGCPMEIVKTTGQSAGLSAVTILGEHNYCTNPLGSIKPSLRQNKELGEMVSGLARRQHASNEQGLKMQKCLIVSKVTRYEYEKHSHDNIEDSELERILRKRGSDYDAMIHTHREQKAFEENVAKSFKEMGLQVEMASRLTYNDELINWCDVVVPCGGDGTFLLAASRVRDANKPVIGFNSAPHKSVGRLCLPTWCSNDVKGALQALKEGRFTWMRRSRIRTTITSEPKLLDTITPVDLHTLHYCRYPPVSNIHDTPEPSKSSTFDTQETNPTPTLATKVLPFLALNEVFIGESVTSRVSLLRLQIDDGQWTHTKSSGLCVTTGTGSTSWHYSINCLRTHSVLELMKILGEDFNINMDTSLEKAREVTERYNQKLMFPPDSEYLAYSVREYITFEEWPAPRGLRVRDRAAAVRVRSHCTDAGLVVDGSVSFPFNDGTEALLEIHPEDSLMTVHMDDTLPY